MDISAATELQEIQQIVEEAAPYLQCAPSKEEELKVDIELQLKRLSEMTGLSGDELLYAGLVLYELGHKVRKEGLKFGVAMPDWELLTEVVGI